MCAFRCSASKHCTWTHVSLGDLGRVQQRCLCSSCSFSQTEANSKHILSQHCFECNGPNASTSTVTSFYVKFLLSDGQISIMSNPHGPKVLESAMANAIMSMFWRSDQRNSLQAWEGTEARVLQLRVNKRSGEDIWFSSVLDQCRAGNLSNDNFCFLHGFPIEVCCVHADSIWAHSKICVLSVQGF